MLSALTGDVRFEDIIDRLKTRLHIREKKAREYYETYRSRA